MSRLLDLGLEELSTNLVRMGELAEEAIRISLDGFLNGVDVSNSVHDYSETIDGMSIDVEDKIFQLIAKFQPVASDLRIIKSYMKIMNDLERYGRYAWDISFIHKRLLNTQQCVNSPQLMNSLVEKTAEMVDISIRALKNHDAELAKNLSKIEEQVDKIYFDYLDVLNRAPSRAKCIVSDALVIRYLERIADHATYVGESVIYIVTGQRVLLR
jgi:phosphate transport system protein